LTPGVFAVDKPVGATSNEIVSRFRKHFGTRRVGHGGTLDPFASGVLVIAVGPFTRLLSLVRDHAKRYRAVIDLGIKTNTYDVTGLVESRTDAGAVTSGDVERFFSSRLGLSEQVPPKFSAVKVNGHRAYDLARLGTDFDLNSKKVELKSFEVVEFTPGELATVVVDLLVGPGFYVRSLANDLGEWLSVGGTVRELKRTGVGEISLSDVWPVDDISAMKPVPFKKLLPEALIAILELRHIARIMNGASVSIDECTSVSGELEEGQLVAVSFEDQDDDYSALSAICMVRRSFLRPLMVFSRGS
jgi:tRNA pseudouridine55 synthase